MALYKFNIYYFKKNHLKSLLNPYKIIVPHFIIMDDNNYNILFNKNMTLVPLTFDPKNIHGCVKLSIGK